MPEFAVGHGRSPLQSGMGRSCNRPNGNVGSPGCRACPGRASPALTIQSPATTALARSRNAVRSFHCLEARLPAHELVRREAITRRPALMQLQDDFEGGSAEGFDVCVGNAECPPAFTEQTGARRFVSQHCVLNNIRQLGAISEADRVGYTEGFPDYAILCGGPLVREYEDIAQKFDASLLVDRQGALYVSVLRDVDKRQRRKVRGDERGVCGQAL